MEAISQNKIYTDCVAPKTTTSKLKTKEICKNMEEQVALCVHVVVLEQYGQLFRTYYY
jgi:hypothetical protein